MMDLTEDDVRDLIATKALQVHQGAYTLTSVEMVKAAERLTQLAHRLTPGGKAEAERK